MNAENLCWIVGKLCSGDAFKFIFNAAVVDFRACDDDADFQRLKGPQIVQLLVGAKRFCFSDLSLFCDEGNDAHGC